MGKVTWNQVMGVPEPKKYQVLYEENRNAIEEHLYFDNSKSDLVKRVMQLERLLLMLEDGVEMYHPYNDPCASETFNEVVKDILEREFGE